MSVEPIRSSPPLFVANECERCRSLEGQLEQARQQLEDVRAGWRLDAENWTNDITLKNRKIGSLKAELVQTREAEPGNGPVKELLLHWRAACGKTRRAYTGPDGKRYKIAKAAIKRHGLDDCKTAIDGLAANKYAGPRGRSSDPYPGSTRYDDLEHALGDEKRWALCFELATGWSPDDHDQASTASLARPSAVPSIPPPPRLQKEGIDELLSALTAHGRAWRPNGLDKWMAQCPAHDDRSPSLSITRKPTRRVLLNCFAGCDDGEIVEILGVSWADLLGDEARTAA